MSIFYEEVVTIPLSPEGVSPLVTRIMVAMAVMLRADVEKWLRTYYPDLTREL
jgi:hypothetical protein